MSFVRDNLTALTMKRQDFLPTSLGDAMDAAGDANGDTDPTLVELHQMALVIVSLRQQANILLQQVSSGDGVVDWDQLTAILNQIADWKSKFQQAAAAYNAANPNALSWPDQAILDVGNWAQSVVQAIPAAVAAIPNAFVNAAGRVATNAGSNLAGALMWPAVILGGLILLTKQAEKTRTYRKVVA